MPSRYIQLCVNSRRGIAGLSCISSTYPNPTMSAGYNFGVYKFHLPDPTMSAGYNFGVYKFHLPDPTMSAGYNFGV